MGFLWLIAVVDTTHPAPSAMLAARAAPQPASGPSAPFCFASTSTPPSLGQVVAAIAPSGNAFISDYTTLSQAGWCTFLALNWKAAGTGSPTMDPDTSAKIGACSNQGTQNCSLVWETWRRSDEVYSAQPLPCSSGPAESKRHILRSVNPNTAVKNPHAPGQLMRQLHGANREAARGAQAVGPPIVNAQATGFMLPDKNNSASNPSLILYEARENPSACTTLTTPITVPGTSTKGALNTANQQVTLYNAASQQKLLPQPPAGFIQFQPTAFEVKPSWYEFQSGDPTPQQLGMVSATGTTSSGTFTIGLTGFHILWKVFPKSTWFWLTFEYAGNNQWTQPYINGSMPPNAYFTPVLGKPVTLYQSGACSYSAPGCAVSNNVCSCPNFGPFGAPAPVPCTTGTGSGTNPAPCDPVGSAAAGANNVFQGMLAGTPFANYQLVGVQVADTLNGANTLLANNQIETDFGSTMANTGGQSNPTSSCITCHYMASIGGCPSGNTSISRGNIFAGFGENNTYQPGWGYSGAFPTSEYTASGGPFLSSDFVWSVQEAPWTGGQKACPSSSASATHPSRGAHAK